MPGLDDPGMDRPDRDDREILALDRQERRRLRRPSHRHRPRRHRCVMLPPAMIQPRPRIDPLLRHMPPQIGDHSLEPNRRRPHRRQRRISAIHHIHRHRQDLRHRQVMKDRVHLRLIRPHRQQRDVMTGRQRAGHRPPILRRHQPPAPWPPRLHRRRPDQPRRDHRCAAAACSQTSTTSGIASPNSTTTISGSHAGSSARQSGAGKVPAPGASVGVPRHNI